VSRATATDLVYLIAIVGFILALKGLSSPRHARLGNLVGAAGMLVAVGWTFSLPQVYSHTRNLVLMVVAIVIGATIAVPAARLVKMTAMPQMVAIFNGVGGGAAALVSVTEFISLPGKTLAVYKICEILFGVLVGSVSFAGSAVAFAKLQELMTGRPITYPGQQMINAAIGVAIVVLLAVTIATADTAVLVVVLVLSLVLGAIFVLPIGGADTPVLISLLNAFTGLAVAASGFTLDSTLLIVAGTLVGASGTLLTRMMSQAMGRSLPNILFSAFGSVITAGEGPGAEGRSVRAGTADDIGVLLAYARKVAIVPGYGLAVAQAQHTARELADALAARGVEVYYAIHPVAGRMPGHMNVLLAEANVPYDEVFELDDINAEFPSADVAFVIGANDVTNPAAKTDPASPIYGMPVLDVERARTVLFVKRGMGSGYAGVENELFFRDNTMMLFGDAKKMVESILKAL
jgi:H+-translocating NAD(P) transhydrogenase subunit beta